MNYAMMTYTVSRQLKGERPDMAAICKLTRDLGMDAMDQISLYDYPPSEIRSIADDHGIRIVAYTFFTGICFPDGDQRRAGMDDVRRAIDAAVVLGAPVVMLPQRTQPGQTRDECRGYAIEAFGEAVALAEDAGVVFTTEHLCGQNPFVTSADMRAACDAVPGLRITYDNGNVFTSGESAADAFTAVQDRIAHVHFKDWRLSDAEGEGVHGLDGRWYTGALIGEGLVDYRELVSAMLQSGYDGYIDIEYEANDYPAEEAFRKALACLRQLEEECAAAG
ncbi:MAG: sugar phosphate isomerase/epimerase [bacterium]|nr:sugar phosphate isomerase/epimerase [bacterium]